MKTLTRHPLQCYVGILLPVIIGLIWLQNAVARNAWSVTFASNFYNKVQPADEVLSYPEGHQRARLWLAKDALVNNQPELAQALIADLAQQGNPYALGILGEIKLVQGDFHGAVQVWTEAGQFNHLLEAAHTTRNEGHFEDAFLAYQAAWGIDIDAVTVEFIHFLQQQYGNRDLAIPLLQEALAKRPESLERVNWMLLLGDEYREAERWGEAESIYREVLTEQPDKLPAYIGLAWVHYGRGDEVEAALKVLQEAIRLDPDFGDVYFAAAQIYASERNFTEADDWFAKAINRNPDAPWYWVERGKISRIAGDNDSAIKIFNEAAEHFPDWAFIYYELALSHKLNDHPQEAIQAIEKGINVMQPPNILFYIRAGEIYEWANLLDEARQAYQNALLIDGTNLEALQGLQRVE
jgi:tetratricopeptide (TPR) repeat protein